MLYNAQISRQQMQQIMQPVMMPQSVLTPVDPEKYVIPIIPDDENAQAALKAAAKLEGYDDPKDLYTPSRANSHDPKLKHLCEEGDVKTHQQNGVFQCVAGYAFTNVVEEAKTYKIYRCDGGHHIAIVFKEFKHQDGSDDSGRKLKIVNGEIVEDEGNLDLDKSNDHFELDQ